MPHLHLHFKVSYLTVWGQKLLLRTREADANVFNGESEMRCRWEGKRLLWEVTLAPSTITDLEYKSRRTPLRQTLICDADMWWLMNLERRKNLKMLSVCCH